MWIPYQLLSTLAQSASTPTRLSVIMLIKRVLVFGFLLIIVVAQRDTVYLKLKVQPRQCDVLKEDRKITEVQMFEEQDLLISINNKLYINEASCIIDKQRQITKLTNIKPGISVTYFPKVNATTAKGQWVCHITLLQDVPTQNVMPTPPSHDSDSQHNPKCVFNLKVMEKALPVLEESKTNWLIIGIVVAVIVTLIIVVQTGVIIYFKKKAFRFNRLQTLSMTVRNSSGKGDDKRYSTKPGPKPSTTLQPPQENNLGDSNTTIYETLNEVRGQDVPPVPPIENIPTLKKKKVDGDTLRNRKPMPLPAEELREEPKPAKSPISIKPQTNVHPIRNTASSSSSLIRPKPATGTRTAAEPILSELDHIFKKRQHGSIPGVQTQGKPTPTPHRKGSNLEPSASHLKHRLPIADVPAKPTVVPKLKPVVPENRPSPLPTSVQPKPAVKKPAVAPPVVSKSAAQPPPAKSEAAAPPVSSKPAVQSPLARSEAAFPPVSIKPAAEPPPARTEVESQYEEYDNSDDEWNYEPLPKYNIYSS